MYSFLRSLYILYIPIGFSRISPHIILLIAVELPRNTIYCYRFPYTLLLISIGVPMYFHWFYWFVTEGCPPFSNMNWKHRESGHWAYSLLSRMAIEYIPYPNMHSKLKKSGNWVYSSPNMSHKLKENGDGVCSLSNMSRGSFIFLSASKELPL